MNALERLRAAIARKTDLDTFAMTDDVIANFFDDKLDMINDILKHPGDDAHVGRLFRELLNSTIAEVVEEHESGYKSDDNRALFDRTEATAINQDNRRVA